MGKRIHRPCPYRTVRKRKGEPTLAYCTAAHGGSDAWPQCTFCRDTIPGGRVKPPRKEKP